MSRIFIRALPSWPPAEPKNQVMELNIYDNFISAFPSPARSAVFVCASAWLCFLCNCVYLLASMSMFSHAQKKPQGSPPVDSESSFCSCSMDTWFTWARRNFAIWKWWERNNSCPLLTCEALCQALHMHHLISSSPWPCDMDYAYTPGEGTETLKEDTQLGSGRARIWMQDCPPWSHARIFPEFLPSPALSRQGVNLFQECHPFVPSCFKAENTLQLPGDGSSAHLLSEPKLRLPHPPLLACPPCSSVLTILGNDLSMCEFH